MLRFISFLVVLNSAVSCISLKWKAVIYNLIILSFELHDYFVPIRVPRTQSRKIIVWVGWQTYRKTFWLKQWFVLLHFFLSFSLWNFAASILAVNDAQYTACISSLTHTRVVMVIMSRMHKTYYLILFCMYLYESARARRDGVMTICSSILYATAHRNLPMHSEYALYSRTTVLDSRISL